MWDRSTMDAFVSLQKVSKFFLRQEERIFALREVDLTVAAGESLAICGKSGAGKSTLLHLIGGLEAASQGRVLLKGREIAALSASEEAAIRNRVMGFVFQFHHLLADFTILENVMLPLLIAGHSRSAAAAAARELLAKVGLLGLENRFGSELSGGEQQRAALARAVIHRPEIILADEPTGNLDDGNAAQVFELLCTLNRDLRSTLIVVTHNEKFAARINRIVRLDGGRIVS